MKRIMMIGLLLSANAALAATDGAIPSLTVPDDMKCSTSSTPAGSEISCVSANPPVAYIDAEGRECHGVQGIPSSFSCKEKVPQAIAAPEPINSPDPPIGSTPDPRMKQIQRRYDLNLKKWQARKQQDYTFTLQLSCHCSPDHTTPMQVTVQNGKVISATTESLTVGQDSQGNPLDNIVIDVAYRALSIDQLFNEIKMAIDNKAAAIDVKYDPKWGYPRSIAIDIDKRLADEELAFTLSNFKPTRKTPVKPLPRG